SSKPSDDWTLLYVSAGEYVHPADQRPRRGYDCVRQLDSVVRYLRWRVTQMTGDWSYPQMDGVREFRVWGLPRDDRAGIKPFKPWVEKTRTPPVDAQTAVLDPDGVMIVPRPRSMTVEDGWFLLGRETKIVAQDQAEARRVAQQIHEEVLERWQLELPIVVEGTAPLAARRNVIYLGLPKFSDRARQVAHEDHLELDPGKPQGYGLRVTPQGISVLGNDELGLYYGAQSLMMAMCWRNSKSGGTAGVHCMKVLDWPGSVLERGLYHRRPYPVMLIYPQSDVHRIRRVCRLLSRFKFNVIYLGPNWHNSLTAGPRMEAWTEGLLPKICREVREEYHVELRPTILYEEGEGGSYWKELSNDARDLREHDPDEDPGELGNSLNLCPLDERTYTRHFAMIDQILEDFAHPGKVWMFGQTYTSLSEGARWVQCRRCRRSGKTPEELYAYFINRIAGHLEARRTTGLFRCPWLLYGGERGPKDRRLIAIDPRRLPASLRYDLWLPSDPMYTCFRDPEAKAFLTAHFKPAQTTNGPPGWAASERYLQDAPQSETEVLASLSGSSASVWGQTVSGASLSDVAETMWYSPDRKPPRPLDYDELGVFVNRWWFGRDFPAWRLGERPRFFPLDLRPFVNHTSHATGTETLESGRPPEIDLRYLPTGLQLLAGVPFDIIDPAHNGGNGLLMLGRPASGTLATVSETIREDAGPIPVGRKLASLVFLRKRWHCRVEKMYFQHTWVRPTCRVVYDDDSWLVVDAFLYFHAGLFFDEWNNVSDVVRPHYRLGWKGNSPTGARVTLDAVEWVNPYPDRTIRHIDFFTPDFEDVQGKRVSDMMEAIVAVTGVEPTERDVAFWKDRPNRPPRLPPREERLDGTTLRPVKDLWRRNDGAWSGHLLTRAGKILYTLKPIGRTKVYRRFDQIYDLAYCDVDFRDFGVEVIFDKPLRLARIDVRGPLSIGGHWGAYSQRTKKADVTVEVSEDGKTWRRAGELRGIAADADFLPVDLDGTAVKSVRMTGTARPYREHYHPVQVQGDIFWRQEPHWNPSFTWRLIAPADPSDPQGRPHR
ncbi:MAG TPA: glycoside hydrolase family 20 zincin-like fold domain-containing protein, partial [Planctomycetota bacterium]|nr:glycoside hydrolase family 20 zincin-like fold domain-containing protein [Planctomycetota bacterium]